LLEEFNLRRIKLRSKLKSFDCADDDLNEFFSEDSRKNLKELLAVTYTFEKGKKTIAFFSVLNDRIQKDETNSSEFNRLNKKIPNEKRRKSYPAVKVGRLGVHKDYQNLGIGSEVLDFIKAFFTEKNKTGCRFITVDAYNNERVIKFYKRNGFKFLTSTDKNDKTRLMYFDLKTFVRD
jgi:GNAT superfamily N-acetyltransferase